LNMKLDIEKAQDYMAQCLSACGGITPDGLFFSTKIFNSVIAWIKLLELHEAVNNNEKVSNLSTYLFNCMEDKLQEKIRAAIKQRLREEEQIRK